MNEDKEKKDAVQTTPVEEYTGQGYSLVDGEKSKTVVEKNQAEIEKRAVTYIKEKYHTDVVVNNVVPARNAAVVMVEAKQPIAFHTSVIVDVDMQNKKLQPDGAVRSEDGEVEKAIVGGLFVKAYAKEFENLDRRLVQLEKKFNWCGMTQEAVNKTADSGFVTTHYFISIFAKDFEQILQGYQENPKITKEELAVLFKQLDPKGEKSLIAIRLYSKTNSLPKEEKVQEAVSWFQKGEMLPISLYNLSVFKNSIVNQVGQSDGENTASIDFQMGGN
ncbi:lipoprotein [Listeria floridensis FSL S10-1187]|uniref:Lipoprotein n=1 Tax=Listeria floridensis FSL S10-1187 TaxID=1265817 RepID=A0ABN0RIV0_9LIST|nr:DUF1672 family protein [Listeria floridensis]EUJ33860.1 lipoprotein [Listeria floridensis FSL S10-1187]